jgi:hypothetical protein
MRRTLSTLVLAATAWSYGAAIQCEMGTVALEATRPTADTPAKVPADPHAHHGGGPTDYEVPDRANAPGHASGESGHDGSSHGHGGDSGDERCLMVMACGVASTVPLVQDGVLHVPARARATLPTPSRAPVVATPSLDPPPPRQSA